MNKRIKELAVEAGAYVPGVIGKAAGHPAISFQSAESFEKFAELIVRECADIANSHFERKVAGYPGDKIEEHFVVK